MQQGKMWGGRFREGPDEAMQRFNTSLPVDARLWRYDLRGSLAHVGMMGACGILTPEDAAALSAGLRALEADFEAGQIDLAAAPDEDIHSLVERLLHERLGPVAGRLHTARSRNDQIALDVRLYLLDALAEVGAAVHGLQAVLLRRAEENARVILPGYTHLQRAQPVLLAHHLLAYFWMLQRDRERLAAARARCDVMPLGAAALAGTTFPIDRGVTTGLLGMSAVSPNSMDSVSSRDHMLESVAALAIIACHLSRLAEEWILWSTAEFGFITLDDRFSTGSSIMPQKKNPDSMELVRGKSGRVTGDLMSLLTMCKGLPLTYNKDLQEDKEPLFDAFDTTLATLSIAAGVVETTTFHVEAMRAAAGGGFSTATDAADYLVRRGVPFREAHEIIGRVVQQCEAGGLELEQLELADWQAVDARFDGEVLQVVTPESSVAARTSAGGTAPERVLEQLAQARATLAG